MPRWRELPWWLVGGGCFEVATPSVPEDLSRGVDGGVPGLQRMEFMSHRMNQSKESRVPMLPAEYNILGIRVNAIDMDEALAAIAGWITRNEPHYVCLATAHSILDVRRKPALLHGYNGAGLITPDGMSLVWILRLVGYRHVNRVYGPDLMLRLCEDSVSRGWSHYFYGGVTGQPEELAARLQALFPGLRVAGTWSPPFRPMTPEEDAEVIHHVNQSRADIVWVGIGSPKQEQWMIDHRERIHSPILIGVGAAFDFHSGRKRQAPRWMQRSGLEWLFRLVTDPLRTGRRCAGYPGFFLMLLLQWAGLRRFHSGS